MRPFLTTPSPAEATSTVTHPLWRTCRMQAPTLGMMVIVACGLSLIAAVCMAETNQDERGRRVRTRAKGVQLGAQAIAARSDQRSSGITIGLEYGVAPAPTDRLDAPSIEARGRLIVSTPRQPVSVGLVGCDGCSLDANGIGPIFLTVPKSRHRGDPRIRRPRRR